MRIAICGIDGAGKSTIINKLFKYYSNITEVRVCKVEFKCKNFFDHILNYDTSIERKVTLRAYMAYDFVNYYFGFQNCNELLLCDRYDICYQVLNKVEELPQKYIDILNEIYSTIPEADLYVYIDVPVQVASMRLNNRGNRANNENDDILMKMKSHYNKELQRKKNVLIIDGNCLLDEIISKIVYKINCSLEVKND